MPTTASCLWLHKALAGLSTPSLAPGMTHKATSACEKHGVLGPYALGFWGHPVKAWPEILSCQDCLANAPLELSPASELVIAACQTGPHLCYIGGCHRECILAPSVREF